MNQRLDSALAQLADRQLAEAFRHLILGANYERHCGLLLMLGVDPDRSCALSTRSCFLR